MSQEDLTRPSWSTWMMRLAYITAQRGSCRRKRVGCVIVDGDHRIISGGYNGAPRGMPDCLTVGCDVRVIDGRESCVRTLHAESNAIDHAGPDCRGAWLITTVVPCRLCALRIVQAGFDGVLYHEFYVSQGTNETLDVLHNGGVRISQLDAPMWDVAGTFGPRLDERLTELLRRTGGAGSVASQLSASEWAELRELADEADAG